MKKNIKMILSVLVVVLFLGTVYNRSVSAISRLEIEQKVIEMTEGKEFDMTRVLVKYNDSQIGLASVASLDGKVIAQVKNVDANKGLDRASYATASDQSIKNVQDLLIELLSDPNVEYAEPNYLGHAAAWTDAGTTSTPSDYSVANHWYYTDSNLPEMWDDQSCAAGGASCGGDASVVVAVIDSGLAFESYDDSGEYGYTDQIWDNGNSFYSPGVIGVNGGKNFSAIGDDYNPANGFNIWVNNNEIAGDGKDNDCNGVIDDYNGFDAFAWYDYSSTSYYYPGASAQDFCNGSTPDDFSGSTNLEYRKMGHPVDTYGHGSYVTGLVSGVLDNVSTTGSVSPASEVTIMPIAANISFVNGFWSSEVLSAIYYATEHGADVINMSLGGFSYSDTLQDAIYYANSNGVVVVAASGNDGVGTVSYPGAFDGVIGVGAVNSDDTRAFYSNYGSGLDMVAYVGQGNGAGSATYQETLACMADIGGCTSSSTFDTTNVQYGVGTSFASPQVAAAAALVKGLCPSASASEVENFIKGTAKDITLYGAGYDSQTGYGVLDFETLWNNVWNNWENVGNTITTPAVIEYNSKMYVFKRGADNSLKVRSFDGSIWTDWEHIGDTTAAPTVAVYSGELYVAKKGLNNSVKVKSYNGSVWSEWSEMGGISYSNPVLAVYGSDLYIMKQGGGNTIRLKSYNGSTWTDWNVVGSTVNPVAMIEYGSKLYMVKRGINNSIKANSYDGSTWSGWESIGGYGISTPVVTIYGTDLYVAKKGGDGTLKVQSYDGTTWNGWTNIGNTSVSPAMIEFDSQLYVIKRGGDDSLKMKRYDGISWSTNWETLGIVTQKPVISVFNGKLYVTKRGADGSLKIRVKN